MGAISIRVDDGLKEQAEKVMSEYGLNMSTTVNMLLKQIVREQAIPLSLGRENNENQLLKDLLAAQLDRAMGYKGKTGDEVADEMKAVVERVHNEQN